MVEPEAGSVLERRRTLEKLDTRVESAGSRYGTREQNVPRLELGGFDPDEVQRRPGACAGDFGGPAVVLDATHAGAAAGGGVEGIARTDLARPQRPRCHKTYPLQHERPVHRQPREVAQAAVLRTGGQLIEGN